MPDLVTVAAVDQAGDVYEMPLAIGDRVRLYGKTYARGAGRGLLGVNGSVVEVRGVQATGLVLRAAGGREGLVHWAARPIGARIRGRAQALAALAVRAVETVACLRRAGDLDANDEVPNRSRRPSRGVPAPRP